MTITRQGGVVSVVVGLPTKASWGVSNMTPTEALIFAEQLRNAATSEMMKIRR
jgi:hypothetical protein